MRNNKQVFRSGGSEQADWDDSYSILPVSEWANEIIGEGMHQMPMPGIIQKGARLRRANRKQWFLCSKITTSTTLWATGTNAVRDSSSYETGFDASTVSVDITEYRTMTPLAWESVDEVGGIVNLEQEVRTNLAHYAAMKLNLIIYQAIDNGRTIDSSYDWISAGSALEKCNDNTVDVGTACSVDNIKSGAEKIVTDLYTPNSVVLPTAYYFDLLSESQFTNAAEFGSKNPAITKGQIPDYCGMSFYLDQHIPDDSSDNDVGFIFDNRYFLGLVVGKDAEIQYENYLNTGEHEFYITMKAGAEVLREKAGCALYT